MRPWPWSTFRKYRKHRTITYFGTENLCISKDLLKQSNMVTLSSVFILDISKKHCFGKYIWPHQLEEKVRNKWYSILFIWRKYIKYLHFTHQLQWPKLVKNIISFNIWDPRNWSILCLAVVPTPTPSAERSSSNRSLCPSSF